MGVLIYNLIIRAYNFLIYTTALFNRKASHMISGRKNTFSVLHKIKNPGDRVIWFHCASLGEFEQGRPVMEILKRDPGNYKIYVSFFSSSGYEVKKDDPLLDGLFYLPADTRANAARLIRLMKPEIAIFVKYEFWYHFFKTCNQQNIPVISISTILRPDQVFFKSFGGFYRKMLRMVDAYYVQNKQTENLLRGIGINQVQITGDTRIDRVHKIKTDQRRLPVIEEFMGTNRMIVLGSTWKPDINLWKSFINGNKNGYKYLIAPHHIDEGNLKYIEHHLSIKQIRFSKIKEGFSESYEVLIMDHIGLLSSIYHYGYVNYVGGSFSEGLHNILEPAVYGAPVLIGKDKSNKKYQEAVGLIEKRGAFEIADSSELERVMNELSENSSFYRQVSDAAQQYVELNIGAAGKIGSSIISILNRENARIGF